MIDFRQKRVRIISVQQKGKGESNANYRYEKKRFNAFEAYIVYPMDTLLNLMSPQDKLKKNIKDNITLALRNNVAFADIMNILNECGYHINNKIGKSV